MKPSFPEIISAELGLLLLPLKNLNSPTRVTAFLKNLGWSLSDGLEIDADLSALVTSTESLVQEIKDFSAAEGADKILALEELVNVIFDVVDTLKTEIPAIKTELENLNTADVNGLLEDLVNVLLRRIVDFLIYTYLKSRRPPIFAVLHILGLAETVADSTGQAVKTIHWNRFGWLFSQPLDLFDATYDWSTNFNGEEFLRRFDLLIGAFSFPGGIYQQDATIHSYLNRAADDNKEIRIPLFIDGRWPDNWAEIDLNLSPVPADGALNPGLLLYPYFQGGISLDADLSKEWELVFEGNADLGAGLGLEIRPPTQLSITTDFFSNPLETADVQAELSVRRKEEIDTEIILIGAAEKTRLALEGAELKVYLAKEGNQNNFGAEVNLRALKLVVSAGDGDGFLQKILPEDGLQVAVDLGLGYSLQQGFYFSGSGTLELQLPTHIPLGPLEIQGLLIALQPLEEGIKLALGATLKIELGPFIGIVENIGVNAKLEFPADGGNIGPAHLSFGFKPPTGIAMSLETSVVKGGGYIFFDPDNARYGGALELNIKDKLAISAIALISTRMPDGSKGFSLLLIISVQFSPGIALGMGFFLNGLGGMLGFNRTMNVEALRDGVKNNTLDAILFPEDIIENIVEIITNIREIFPVQQDQFMIGFMAKITWGVPQPLLSLEFGLAIEFPNPIRIAILGVLKLVLPDEDRSVVQLQINFLGIIDFEARYLSFDASLFNSSILMMTLEGDVALRLFWGDQKAFLFSVGGFHPTFQPDAALQVGDMDRLTLNILSGNPSLNLTAYFALTSNTVQFGSLLSLSFEVSNFAIEGYFGFDVLFQFSPFQFLANVRAGVSVRSGTRVILIIQLTFDLQGPRPWIARGVARFEVLGIGVNVNFNETWGENDEAILPKVAVLPQLLQALEQDLNWTSEFPENRMALVSLRELEEGEVLEGEVLLHALGELTISQEVIPLDTLIEKHGNNEPQDIKRATIKRVLIESEEVNIDAVSVAFAPANYLDLSDQDKLKTPSFVEEKSGIAVTETSEIKADYAIGREVVYEVVASDYHSDNELPYALTTPNEQENYEENESIFTKLSKGGAVGKSTLSKEKKRKTFGKQSVQIQEEQFVIVNASDLSLYTNEQFQSGTEGAAREALYAIISKSPKLKHQLQIVPEYYLEELALV